MPDTFNCPNCGAPLDYHGTDPMIRCPYCSSSVIVPDNLRAQPSFSSRQSNFTLTGLNRGNLGALVQQAQRFKEVRDLAQAGQIERAAQIYRELTGADEGMARIAVEALGRGQPIVLSSGSTSFGGAVETEVTSFPTTSFSTTVSTADGEARGRGSNAWLVGCFGIVAGLLVIGLVLFGVLAAGGTPSLLGSVGIGFARQQLVFGGQGSGPGLFDDVRAIAVNPATGVIYAADYGGGRVQAFDASGKFVTQWLVGDKKTYISDMAADAAGRVFVVANGRVLAYDQDGQALGPVELGDDYVDRVALAPDGSLFAVVGSDDLARMSPDGKVTTYPGILTAAGADTDSQMTVAIDGAGTLYVLSPQNYAVFKFSPDGKFINRFGSEGDSAGQFDVPEEIAVDGQGRIYVSDFDGIKVYENDGRYVTMIEVDGVAFGLAFDGTNSLYATSSQEKVYKLGINGAATPAPGSAPAVRTPEAGEYGLGFATPLFSVGGKGTDPGMFNDVRSVAVDPATGMIFAGEYDGGRLQVFDGSGNYVTEWTVPGENATIYAVTVDQQGRVFVVVSGKVLRYDPAGKLQKTWDLGHDYVEDLDLAPDGNLLALFGGGSDGLRLVSPDGKTLKQYPDLFEAAGVDSDPSASLAVDTAGDIFLLNSYEAGIFKFAPDGTFVERFSGEGDAAGQLDSPDALAVDSRGRIYVSDGKGIQVFSPDGKFLRLIGRATLGNAIVFGMSVDPQGNLYAVTNLQTLLKIAIADEP